MREPTIKSNKDSDSTTKLSLSSSNCSDRSIYSIASVQSVHSIHYEQTKFDHHDQHHHPHQLQLEELSLNEMKILEEVLDRFDDYPSAEMGKFPALFPTMEGDVVRKQVVFRKHQLAIISEEDDELQQQSTSIEMEQPQRESFQVVIQ